MIGYMTYDDGIQIEYFSGVCRFCGSFHRFYPEDYVEADTDYDLPEDAFDCCGSDEEYENAYGQRSH